MRQLAMALAVGLAAMTGAAEAHGPSRLNTDQSVSLNASPDEVWAVVGDFTDMSWYPGVAKVEATGNDKGATRVRTMEDGQVLHEELLKRDDERHAISVRFTEDNLEAVKATNYASHITLKDQGGKTLLDWKGAFYRAYPNNNPPADQNDEASAASVEAAHQKGIDALVERFGKAE